MNPSEEPAPSSVRPGLDSYDQSIDWPARWSTEGDQLLGWLATGPNRRVLDLGSATGEYAAWLAERGHQVVGIEGVRERWEVAVAQAPAGVEHLIGDLGAVEAMVRGHFGAAICLGNTLPALLGTESLARMLVGLRRRLLPGAPFIAQLENFERLRAVEASALPIRTQSTEGGDLVFLRLLDLRDDGVVDATETILRHRPLADPPVELISSRPVFQQGWTLEQLQTVLEIAQFSTIEAFGGFGGEPFDALTSTQLVLVAR